ncbi:glycerophosphodiester phosphodiesterase family protein [Hoeflea sp. CAU 1731]
MKDRLTGWAQDAADIAMAMIPRRTPDAEAVKRCRIVAHRGAHDYNRAAKENTLEAFELARAAGVWGVETDIRWTADLTPVICHDPDTARVFGKDARLCDVSFEELRAAVPAVPSVAEAIARFGGRLHLMLELKAERFPDIGRQKAILAEHLAGLAPGADYHMMALDPDLFETFDIQPRQCCLPVAMTNMAAISRRTLGRPYGGVTGHYLLLTDAIKRRHEAAGQKVGTGFVKSRNCLYREINRGMEWIFSNDAVAIQRMLDSVTAL